MKTTQEEQLVRVKEVLERDRIASMDVENEILTQFQLVLSKYFNISRDNMKLELRQDNKGVFLRFSALGDGLSRQAVCRVQDGGAG